MEKTKKENKLEPLVDQSTDTLAFIKAKKSRSALFLIGRNEKTGELNNKTINADAVAVQIYQCFGTVHGGAGVALLTQAMNALPGVKKENAAERADAQITPLLHGVAPRDEIEGMLAVQMVSIHNLAMHLMMRAGQSTSNERQVCDLNMATKLNRTFVAQIEALARHRGKGQQKITVEHVHIESGGQAIVGSVTHRGGEGAK